MRRDERPELFERLPRRLREKLPLSYALLRPADGDGMGMNHLAASRHHRSAMYDRASFYKAISRVLSSVDPTDRR